MAPEQRDQCLADDRDKKHGAFHAVNNTAKSELLIRAMPFY